MNELYRHNFVEEESIFLNLHKTSSCFPTFLVILVTCLSKSRELSITKPQKLKVINTWNLNIIDGEFQIKRVIVR